MTVGKHWRPSFGGLGDLEGAPGLREVFDDVEGLHADAADGEEVRELDGESMLPQTRLVMNICRDV